MDVRMPDGTVVRNVPDNITQEDLQERFELYQEERKAAKAAPIEAAPPEQKPEEAVRPIPGANIVTDTMGALAEPVKGLFGQSKYQNQPLEGSVMQEAPPTEGLTPQAQAQAAYERTMATSAAERQVKEEQRAKIMAESKEEYGFKPEDSALEDVGTTLKRSLAKGYYGLVTAGGGQVRFLKDMLGIDSAETAARLDDIAARTEGMGAAINKPAEYVEGAISSITQQLPALAGGVLTGSEGLVLSSMFLNSFGQSYDDSRREGLGVGDSTARGAIFGALEVLGEKFGLGDTLKAIKAAGAGKPVTEMIGYFAKALAKEIPGEELTYAGQFAADKGFGLNPEAGIREFLQGAVDTMAVTVLQSGMMMGAGAGVNKAIRSMSKTEEKLQIAKAEEEGLPKQAAAQEGKAKALAVESAAAEEAPPAAPVAEEPTTPTAPTPTAPTTEQGIFDAAFGRYREMGFPQDAATNLANEEVKEARDAGQIDTGAGEPSVSVPVEPRNAPTVGAETAKPEGLAGVSVPAGVPADGERVEQRALKESSTGLEELGGAAKAIADNMYKTLFDALQQGKTVVAGVKDPVLVRAKEAFDAGLIKSPEDLQRFENEGYPTETAGVEETPATTVTGEPAVTPETPPVTKGKRGRPAKTAEEKAAGKAAYAVSGRKKVLDDARYKINNAIDYLGGEIDPTLFPQTPEGQAAYDNARTELRAKKVEALKNVYRIKNDPALKGTKALKTANEIWNGLDERAKGAIETVVKNENAGVATSTVSTVPATPASTLTESTDGADNQVYNKFTNATQALNWLTRNGNEFERTLAKRLAPFNKDVKLVIVRDMKQVPEAFRDKYEGANGLYDEASKTIYLSAAGGINNTVFLHEALHGATLARINEYYAAEKANRRIDPELKAAVEGLLDIMYQARGYYGIVKLGIEKGLVGDETIKRIVGNMDEFDRAGAMTDVKEFITYGMTHPTFQEYLAVVPGQIRGEKATGTNVANGFTRFVQSIRKMFGMGENTSSALQDLIIVSDALLRSQLSPKQEVASENAFSKIKSKQNKQSKQLQQVQLSNSAHQITGYMGGNIRGKNFKDYKDLLDANWQNLDANAIKAMLFNMQLTDILRWKGDEIPGLNEVDRLLQEAATMRIRKREYDSKIAKTLQHFIHKNGMQVLSDVMHLARLHEVSPKMGQDAAQAVATDPIVKHYDKLIADPANTKEQRAAFAGKRTQRVNAINEVYAKWEELGKRKNGQHTYDLVRQYYRDNYTAYRTLLNKQIDNLQIDDADKAKLLKSVRLMHEQGLREVAEDYDGAAIPRLPEDYFPFNRYGSYYLRVKKGPTGRELWLFEDGAKRNLFLQKLAEERGLNPEDSDVFEAGNDINAIKQEVLDNSMMLQKMFATINEAGSSGEIDTDALKDQLYQTYLMTLPERSFRRKFLHAENITGFSADIMRNFIDSSNKYSVQLARLQYGVQVDEQLGRARDSLEGRGTLDRAKYEQFVNEVAARAKADISPPPPDSWDAAAHTINQVAYIWLLTSGATAAVQMASVPTMVMPNLAANYGYIQSSKAFGKYMQIWKSMGITETDANGEVTFTGPSIGNSKLVQGSELLQRAFEAALDRGVTSITNTSILTNRGRTPDQMDIRGWKSIPGISRTLYNCMTAPFNAAERLSREMTYMMTFELEYKKNGGKFDEAVDKAVESTYEWLGRYDQINRPRSLTGKGVMGFLGKTVGQFKQYAVTMTSFLTRNIYNSVRISIPLNERAAAMHRLTGVLVLGTMFYGAAGLPGFDVLCDIIDFVLNMVEGDDDEDRKKRRERNPLTADSSKLRFIYQWLPDNFGSIHFKGIDGREHQLSDIIARGPISELSDINFGSRMALNGMWWRDGDPGTSWTESISNLVAANLGPAASVGKTFMDGIKDINDGHIHRGLEKLVPAFFKGPLVSHRLATEGAETKKGDVILKKSDISDLTLAAATLGFQPTSLARIQEHNFRMTALERIANKERTKVLGQYAEADFKNDKEAISKAEAAIERFNKRYPTDDFYIDENTKTNALNSFYEQRDMTYRGLKIPDDAEYMRKTAKSVAPLPKTQ